MTIHRKTLILLIIYVLAAVLILGGFVIKTQNELAVSRRQIDAGYSRAFAQLATSVDKISTSMQKAQYVSSPAMLASICAEIYSEASAARDIIGVLPFSTDELEKTSSFAAQTGDYAYYLMKSSGGGTAWTADEADGFAKLTENAGIISRRLTELQNELVTGAVSFSELSQTAETPSDEKSDERQTDNATEFPEMPTLIYDGPFSASIADMKPKCIENAAEISEKEAVEIAKEFCGSAMAVENSSGGKCPVYSLADDNGAYAEITKQGGQIMRFDCGCDGGDTVLTDDEAVKKAEEFLAAHGYDRMRSIYWEKDDGELTANFAYEAGDIIIYPDMVKVTVALDSGKITGFDGKNYVMSHTERTIEPPKISADSAAEKISPALKIENTREVIIPTSGKNEKHCYEFKCRDKNGSLCLIYLNADTGAEEKVLLLIENESGTLTI